MLTQTDAAAVFGLGNTSASNTSIHALHEQLWLTCSEPGEASAFIMRPNSSTAVQATPPDNEDRALGKVKMFEQRRLKRTQTATGLYTNALPRKGCRQALQT